MVWSAGEMAEIVILLVILVAEIIMLAFLIREGIKYYWWK